MGDSLCESAVVGHQQQALAVLVETAHGVQAGRDVGHQLHDRLAAQLVAGGGDIAAGLVQSQIVHLLVLLDIDALVVHMEDVAVGVHLVAHLHGVAVDLHAALGDDLLGGAAGAQALLAHDFLNAFFCHDKISLCASRRSNAHPLPFSGSGARYQNCGSEVRSCGVSSLPQSSLRDDSSLGEGASGEEGELCGMPGPPLVRGGGIAKQ